MMFSTKMIRLLIILIVFAVTSSTAIALAESAATQVDPTEMQKALSEAGFYKGSIDGVVGKKTKEALRSFQEANGLKVDGVCGPKTWEKLKAYLEEAAAIDATASNTATAAVPATTATPVEAEVATTPTLDEEEASYDYGYSEYDSAADSEAGDELKQKLVS